MHVCSDSIDAARSRSVCVLGALPGCIGFRVADAAVPSSAAEERCVLGIYVLGVSLLMAVLPVALAL